MELEGYVPVIWVAANWSSPLLCNIVRHHNHDNHHHWRTIANHCLANMESGLCDQWRWGLVERNIQCWLIVGPTWDMLGSC